MIMDIPSNQMTTAVNARVNNFDGSAIHRETLGAINTNTVQSDKRREAPIGLFDSGVGGLSVYLHLAEQLPTEQYIYYADTLNVPYGNRDSHQSSIVTALSIATVIQPLYNAQRLFISLVMTRLYIK